MNHANAAAANRALAQVFSELVDGASDSGDNVILNGGDGGLLRSLERLSAAEASRSADDVPKGAGGSATIAAHVQHVRFGLSLLNRWARDAGIRAWLAALVG